MSNSNALTIVVCGLPGAGKSSVAEAISKRMGVPIFSVDPIESAIIRGGIPKSFETGLAAYIVAETLAEEQLKLGQSVIIDAVSGVVEAKDMWRNLAQRTGSDLKVVECGYIDESLHKQRLAARVRNLPGFEEVTWDRVLQARSEYAAWTEPHLSVDSARTLSESVKEVIHYLGLS